MSPSSNSRCRPQRGGRLIHSARALPLPRARAKARWLLAIWLAVLIGAGAFVAFKAVVERAFYTNILELLPTDDRNEAHRELREYLTERFQNRALILLRRDEQAREAALWLTEAFAKDDAFKPEPATQMSLTALGEIYAAHSQQLLRSDTRAWLAETSPQAIAEQTWRNLYAPLQPPRPYAFGDDPFNLGWPWLQGLMPQLNLGFDRGLAVVDQDKATSWYLVAADLQGNAFELQNQQAMARLLADFAARFPKVETVKSGMIFHAMGGTRQARQEITTVGLGSLAGILALTLWTFRSLHALTLVALVLSAATVIALAGCFALFGRIHLITLAFGSTLLGLAVDYVYHFLLNQQPSDKRGQGQKKLARALALGVGSSTLAFLLQWLAPFPGLHQMATFCALGLVAAWASLLVLAPFFSARAAPRSPPAGFEPGRRALFALYRRLSAHRRWLAGVLAVFFLSGIALTLSRGANDSILHLNTSPPELLGEEQRARSILNTPSGSRSFYLQAESPEALVDKLHELDALLVEYQGAGHPELRWQSPAQFIPTAEQQLRDRELVARKLYGESGALNALAALLQTPLSAPKLPDSLFTYDRVYSQPLANLLAPFRAVRQTETTLWHTLVPVSGAFDDRALAAIAARVAGVQFENTTRTLSELLGRYRVSVASSLALALGLLGALFVGIYKRDALRIVAPVALSVAAALAVSSFHGVTLFHLIALLLVIGISIDTCAFYLELGVSAHTWLATTVSSATSILAFGLLALSKVPVLHQFGSVVLTGLIVCWLVSPLFFRLPSACDSTYPKSNRPLQKDKQL